MLNETPLRALPDSAEDFAVADCIEDCVAAARGAISDNTERALRSDLGIYAAWCGKRGLAAVPASPATVAAFIDEMAAVRAPAIMLDQEVIRAGWELCRATYSIIAQENGRCAVL